MHFFFVRSIYVQKVVGRSKYFFVTGFSCRMTKKSLSSLSIPEDVLPQALCSISNTFYSYTEIPGVHLHVFFTQFAMALGNSVNQLHTILAQNPKCCNKPILSFACLWHVWYSLAKISSKSHFH